MTMAASVELRPPFLDHDIVEFSLGLPDDLLVRGGVGKWLVKQVARRHLPDEIVDRPKSGFRVPLDSWFRDGLRDFTHDLVRSPSSVTARYLDRASVDALFDAHASGDATRARGSSRSPRWRCGTTSSGSPSRTVWAGAVRPAPPEPTTWPRAH